VSLDGGAPRTSLILTKGLVSTPIDVGDGSLAATVAAINGDKTLGVTASMVQMVAATDSAPAQYRLQLTSTTTGANSAVSLKAADGVLLVPTVAVAVRTRRSTLGGGTLIARSSNTISDVMEGVTLTLSKADAQTGGVFTGPAGHRQRQEGRRRHRQQGPGAGRRRQRGAQRRQEPDRDDPVSKVKGRLYGDSMVRGLVDEVRSTIPGAQSKVAEAGVSVDRSGVISFD
jgi:flagellar hook-associated protein 2